jgi:hypothetical protein
MHELSYLKVQSLVAWIYMGYEKRASLFLNSYSYLWLFDNRNHNATKYTRECIQKFPDWVDNEINNNKTLVEKQHKELWRKNSLDWLTK